MVDLSSDCTVVLCLSEMHSDLTHLSLKLVVHLTTLAYLPVLLGI